MTTQIALPIIGEALGHSLVYDEYKGDFAQARQQAETALHAARAHGDFATLADALLARGIVHLLQGEAPAALRCFVEVRRSVPQDAATQLRAVSYSFWASLFQYNLFPDGSGAGGNEITARWAGIDMAGNHDQQRSALLEQVDDPALLLEAHLVHLCSRLHAGRAFLANRHALPPKQAEQIALPPVVHFEQYAKTVGAEPSVLGGAFLILADLARRGRREGMMRNACTQAEAHYGEANDTAGMAACHMLLGDWHAAPFSSPLVWNFAIQESPSENNRLAALEALEFSRVGQDIAAARAAYDTAADLFAQIHAPRGSAAVELRRGYLAMVDNDYAAAIAHVTRAGDSFAACGDRLQYWLAQAQLALSHVGAGHLPPATDIARSIGLWGATIGSFSYALGLGLLFGRAGRHWLLRQGNGERALGCYQLAEALYQALGAESNRAQSMVDHGTTYEALGEWKTAVTLYEQALDLLEEAATTRPALAPAIETHRMSLVIAVFNLYLQEMNVDGMKRNAQRIQTLLHTLPGEGVLMQTLRETLAGSQPRGTDQPSAVADMNVDRIALSQWGRSVIQQAGVFVPLYIARQAENDGNVAEAEQLYAQALTAARTAGDGERTFLEVAVLGTKRDYAEGIKAVNTYLAQGGSNAGFAGSLLQVMTTVGGSQGQAEARRQQERTHELAFTMLVRLKAYNEALPHLQALQQSAGTEWWKQDARPWRSLSDCGELYEGLNDLPRAQTYYDQAIEQLKARRALLSRDELRSALAADKGAQYLYFQAARTAAKQHDWRRAFAYAEQGKARALLDLMATTSTAPRAEDEIQRRWRQLNAQRTLRRGLLAQERNRSYPDEQLLATLHEQLKTDDAELQRVEAELAHVNPAFYGTVSPQAPIMSLDEVRAALPPDTVLLYYFFLGEDLLAWAITHDEIAQTHHTSVDVRALNRQIHAFHKACMARRNITALDKELSAILLHPFADTIQAHQRLIIVPYGAAHLLPFHALTFNKEPLGITHRISYLPSASTLQFRQRDTPKRQTCMLAIGNPTGDLRGASTEAAFVASLYGEHALIGAQATEAAVRERLPGATQILFATHGILSPTAPLSSAIRLVDDEITVYELMGLHLDADLVVLSACDTGRGETTGGDDVLGLTRGLLGAGARAVIVSLWAVNDVSTSLFMGEFYRRLHAGAAPAAALHAAQVYLRTLSAGQIDAEYAKLQDHLRAATTDAAVLHPVEQAMQERHGRPSGAPASAPADYSHPYYWAPFVLVG